MDLLTFYRWQVSYICINDPEGAPPNIPLLNLIMLFLVPHNAFNESSIPDKTNPEHLW